MNSGHEVKAYFTKDGGGGGRKKGSANMDVLVGGSLTQSGTTLDLRNQQSTTIHVRNGGTGGELSWRATPSYELRVTPRSGRLTKGKSKKLTVFVRKRDGKAYGKIMIVGRAGKSNKGRANAGRVLLYFRVR